MLHEQQIFKHTIFIRFGFNFNIDFGLLFFYRTKQTAGINAIDFEEIKKRKRKTLIIQIYEE